MRFKASIKNANTFIKLTASLNLLGKVAWVRLDNDNIRFTVVPEQGTQVWAVISIDSIFDDDYTIQSASENNTINLEVPLAPLHRALNSARNASSASIRLTKKDNAPLLSVTISIPTPLTTSNRPARNLDVPGHSTSNQSPSLRTDHDLSDNSIAQPSFGGTLGHRETTITQDVSIRVLPAASVEGIHEPRSPEPEVHIMLPPLLQLKSISERFTRLSLASKPPKTAGLQSDSTGPKLELAANMHGELKLGIKTDALKIESRWTGLTNPELDPGQVEGGEEGIRQHPSTRMRTVAGQEAWATVRVEGRDWARVLGVGRMGGRVVACFCDGRAVILYVYLPSDDGVAEESVLTYYISSYTE